MPLIVTDTSEILEVAPEVSAFVNEAVAAIKRILSAGERTCSLTPYRHGDCEHLGFDWSDSARNGLSFTFTITGGEIDIPLGEIEEGGADIWVPDATDALRICQLVARGVNGHSRVLIRE